MEHEERDQKIKLRIRQQAFLAALVRSAGNVCAASRETGTKSDSHYKWIKSDAWYRAEHSRILDELDRIWRDAIAPLIREWAERRMDAFERRRIRDRDRMRRVRAGRRAAGLTATGRPRVRR